MVEGDFFSIIHRDLDEYRSSIKTLLSQCIIH